MVSLIQYKLIELNIPIEYSVILAKSIVILLTLIIAIVASIVANKIIINYIKKAIIKSKNQYDDILVNSTLLNRLSYFIPILIIYFGMDILLPPNMITKRILLVALTIVSIHAISALLNATVDVYEKFEVSKKAPIKGYIQLIKMFLYIIGAILAISMIIDKSPWALLSGIGAMTAIILLLFKDSILGLVAGIQINVNNMVNIGDWIEMPQYGADGDVIDITLNTVKIQNWDKTISTIPTYALISDSFKNWKGMSLSGGRRIKRNLYIDMNSIKFCDEKMIKKLSNIQLIKSYLQEKTKEIISSNKENKIDLSCSVNGRKLTNIGTFRAYVKEYLKSHPKITNEMTLLVRHMQPGEMGLPIQIYAFANDTNWANYESIQADIFDHLLAVLDEFELQVFQSPSGNDLATLGNK